MSSKVFYSALLVIAVLGFFLRLNNYDRIPPFGETKDEFLYPWLGISLIQTGVPTGWSFFPSYTNAKNVTYWSEQFRIVSPWLEKPPLYSLIVGSFALLSHENQFGEIRLATVRLVPIILSLTTIFLTGFVAAIAFDHIIGLVASLIYATTPIIVMSNRMSVTENLLTPLFLCGLLCVLKTDTAWWKKLQPYILGIISFAILATKQTGIAFPLAFFILSYQQKSWDKSISIILGSILALIIIPLMGIANGWQLYQNLQKDLWLAVNPGFPEAFTNFFRFIGIGHKESLFFDGTLFAGYIVLFASPLLRHNREENFLQVFLGAFLYVMVLVVVLSGATWYGWYTFPLYPFITAMLAITATKLWNERDILLTLFFLTFIGMSSLRFVLLIHPDLLSYWQIMAGTMFGTTILLWLSQKPRVQKAVLFIFFVLYIWINIYTVMHLGTIYPSHAQPL